MILPMCVVKSCKIILLNGHLKELFYYKYQTLAISSPNSSTIIKTPDLLFR